MSPGRVHMERLLEGKDALEKDPGGTGCLLLL